MEKFMVLYTASGKGEFVKELEFFRSQKGFEQDWGRNWVPVEAKNLEEARSTPHPENYLELWEKWKNLKSDSPLTFAKLSTSNRERCESDPRGFRHGIMGWTPTDWACAMAGEAGEACNKVKKLLRGDFAGNEAQGIEAIGKEIADMVTYGDLLAQRLGLDLGECVRAKFNEVSKRIGCGIEL